MIIERVNIRNNMGRNEWVTVRQLVILKLHSVLNRDVRGHKQSLTSITDTWVAPWFSADKIII